MFGRFLPKETSYFDFFDKHASLMVQSAKTLLAIASSGQDFSKEVEKIRTLEHEADVQTHLCLENLHKTFITPFNRDDIFRLISCMDDVIDNIDAAADCLLVYKIKTLLPEVKDLANLILESTQEIESAVKMLRDLKNSSLIRTLCLSINRLENVGDVINRNAIANLFETEGDARFIIKWNQIYEHLENALDKCEDVANIIEGVILEYD